MDDKNRKDLVVEEVETASDEDQNISIRPMGYVAIKA